ncbi:hypothetical protein CA265_17725 [Sphingobacteriaceae bacterium GW460-11-11-14-LB5]|nr:hypothetical protein CA265_17725 [Sphingobacteriaceae bacterium GW460-11-11-14-LB5]
MFALSGLGTRFFAPGNPKNEKLVLLPSPLPEAGGRLQRYPAATRYEEAKRKSGKREETFCSVQALRSK